MGGGANNDQFKQIDESPRAWYPPTADDIGKKICANCEDNFDQGYCRYSEAGPVEADPVLISMVESALENGRYEVREWRVERRARRECLDVEGGEVRSGDGVMIHSLWKQCHITTHTL